jgi:hypothetical protein
MWHLLLRRNPFIVLYFTELLKVRKNAIRKTKNTLIINATERTDKIVEVQNRIVEVQVCDATKA